MAIPSITTTDHLSSIATTMAAPKTQTDPAVKDFATSLRIQLAEVRAQTTSDLLSATSGNTSTQGISSGTPANSNVQDMLAQLTGTSSTADPSGISGLSPTGRNIALNDPESAYKMMSLIREQDVQHKAQRADLSAMKSAVVDLQAASQPFAAVTSNTSASDLKQMAQAFVDKYNGWSKAYTQDVQSGTLAGTQAAEIALSEVKQSVTNQFNGAAAGLHGLADIGIQVDPTSNIATFDASKFDSAIQSNPKGVASAASEFGANFAKTTDLLRADNNFIAHQMANLDNVIGYVANNLSSLTQEFGSGDAPSQSSVYVNNALKAYSA